MGEIEEVKRQVIAEVDRLAPKLWEAAQIIGRNPELGHQETQAVATLTRLLASGDIEAEIGVAGLATAWRARVGSRRRPTVALLAEMDALPNIGHGCGHNLIGPSARRPPHTGRPVGTLTPTARRLGRAPGTGTTPFAAPRSARRRRSSPRHAS